MDDHSDPVTEPETPTPEEHEALPVHDSDDVDDDVWYCGVCNEPLDERGRHIKNAIYDDETPAGDDDVKQVFVSEV